MDRLGRSPLRPEVGICLTERFEEGEWRGESPADVTGTRRRGLDGTNSIGVLTTHRHRGIMSTVKKQERWGLFEWDPDKATGNEGKHGIRFADACEVFNDLFHDLEDASDQGEERVGLIGLSPSVHPIHPLYVVAKDLGENHWRIISARLATKQERRRYED